MSITVEEVRRLAAWCRIGLDDGETVELKDDLETILDYVRAMDAVDTSGVSPMTSVAQDGSLRPDIPSAGFSIEDLSMLSGYDPASEHFAMPAIFGGDSGDPT